MDVSVIIKAYNEQDCIARSIESAIAAIETLDGEVILADSLSTDHTIDIAKKYPITIVQAVNAKDRRCGIGPQLGFQHAKGDFIYILDADMELDKNFLVTGLDILRSKPRLGGVAGIVTEKSEANYQFQSRKRRNSEGLAGNVEWLDMGGLYRRKALESVAYFSNRNLHAFEEQELGLRLTHAGWSLERVNLPSVTHYGYDIGTFALLAKRWKSKYINGSGEVIRASLGKQYFLKTVVKQKHLLLALCIWCWLIIGLIMSPWTQVPLIGLGVILFLIISVRYARGTDLKNTLIGIVVWQVSSIGLLRGLLTPQVDPNIPLEDNIIHISSRKKQ